MVLITPLRMGPIQRYRHFLYIINEKQPTFKYAIEGWLFFLAQKFVLSIIIRIFAAREPAKPLNDAQMCGSFLKAVTAPFQACFVELRFYFCSDILLIIRKKLVF